MSTKVCSKCGEEKDESEYRGIRAECKTCEREYGKEYRKNNIEKIKACQKKYRENNIEKTRSRWENYYLQNKDHEKIRRAKYRDKNKEQLKEYEKKYRETFPEKQVYRHKKYYEENSEKEKERVRRYAQTPIGKITNTRIRHRRRALSKDTPCTLTLIQWEKILESQSNKCSICGKRFCKSIPPTKDHIIPVSKGGGLTFENVQALCRSCNSSKNARLDHTKIITWCMS